MPSRRLQAYLVTLCFVRAVAVAPTQSRLDSQLVDAPATSVHSLEPEDALGPVMRREALGKHVDVAIEQGLKPVALEQRESRVVHEAGRRQWANQSKTEAVHTGSKSQKPTAPPDSIVQALSRQLLKIPESQKPVYAAAFLMIFGASGFLFYALLSMKWGREERESAMRRKLLSMRASFGMAGPQSKGWNAGSKGADLNAAKGLGKGKGKLVGKGSLKGALPSKGLPLSAKGSQQSEALLRPLPLDALGLGIGKRSKGPGSVSSIASSQTSGVCTSVSHSLAARSSASTWTSPEEETLPKKVKGRCREVESAVSDLLCMLRAAEKIQRAWRRWKAGQKLPRDGQLITFLCDVLEGESMPNVNRFGGCDPFIECRIVKDDPSTRPRGDLDLPPLRSAQTDVRRNDMAPRWGQRLVLADLTYEKGLFVQLALWDYNLSRSQPIGHVAMPIDCALTTHGFRRQARSVEVSALPGVEVTDLRAKVSIQCSYRETFKYRLVVASGSGLPQAAPSSNAVPTTKLASSLPLSSEMQPPTAICSYVEARVLSDDPRKALHLSSPSNATQCFWSGRTDSQGHDGEHVWDKEFQFNLDAAAEPLWLQLLLWEANTNAPVGHAVMELTKADATRHGADCHHELVDYTLQLEDMPEHPSVAVLSESTLAIRIGCEIA